MDRFLGAFVEMGFIQPLLWTGAGARARGAAEPPCCVRCSRGAASGTWAANKSLRWKMYQEANSLCVILHSAPSTLVSQLNRQP